MSQNQRNAKKKASQKPKNKWLLPAVVAAAVVVVVVVAVSLNTGEAKNAASQQPSGQSVAAAGASQPAEGNGPGITVNKKDVTSTATFIPYEIGNTKMELIAVRADDGTVRTSLNTCQVCWDSGRGYYKQEGNELVCQNCGNRFNINQIEKQKNGCNPVPVTSEEKTENDNTITISGDALATYKQYFQK